MESSRYHEGLKRLLEMEGETGGAVIEKMKLISPDFTRYLLEFIFGEIYARPGLDIKTKETVTIAGMVTLCAGKTPCIGKSTMPVNWREGLNIPSAASRH